MRLLLPVLLAGCDLTKIGVYGCDDYCDQMIDKALVCAEEDGISFDDFAGDSQEGVQGACQVEADEMDEAECQSQSGLVNNATCDELLGLMAF